MLSSIPFSRFITLSNRPIVQENGEITQGSLRLHYWEWKGHQPTILITHGASFHGRCYDRIINEALSGFHIIALDFRGHGRSQKHPPPCKFRWVGEDTLHFIESLNLSQTNLLGIGHSMGGYALTLAAAIAPRRLFQSLLLLDPVIFSSSIYGMMNSNFDFVLRRKNQWLSMDDMISKIGKRQPFSRWPENVLRDYCTYGIDEHFQLLCTPGIEASIYESSSQNESNIYQMIKDSKFIHNIPIEIVRSSIPIEEGHTEGSPTASDLVNYFKKGQDRQLKDGKHLFPMEQPEIVIDLVKEFIKKYKDLHAHL